MSETGLSMDAWEKPDKKRSKKVKNAKNAAISLEDYDIIVNLNSLNSELKSIHSCLDNVTDPILIDSYIYEIKALNMKYKYYLKMCKEKGIVANLM
jgi:hypothetical protein